MLTNCGRQGSGPPRGTVCVCKRGVSCFIYKFLELCWFVERFRVLSFPNRSVPTPTPGSQISSVISLSLAKPRVGQFKCQTGESHSFTPNSMGQMNRDPVREVEDSTGVHPLPPPFQPNPYRVYRQASDTAPRTRSLRPCTATDDSRVDTRRASLSPGSGRRDQ